MKSSTKPPIIAFPCAIVVDSREQLPYAFADLHADARDGYRPLAVTLRNGCLPEGDYSLEGFENQIAVERKSLADLYGTLGQGRGRFQRELERLDALSFAAVVVEADWREVLMDPPDRSRLNPKTVYRSVIAWQQRRPRVHWWFCVNRRMAEITTFRILERFYRDQQSKNCKK